MPSTALRVAQYGIETTWGTAVVATRKMMGLSDVKFKEKNKTIVTPVTGTYAPGTTAALVGQSGEVTVSGVATYEELIWYFDSLFSKVTAPTGTGPYVYAYAAPTSADATPRLFTVEFGTTGALYKAAGALTSKFKISGAAQDYWKFQADYMAKSIATLTSLAALSDNTVTSINAMDTACYIDDWGGTIGTTAITGTLIDFDLEVTTGRHLKQFVGDGVNPTNWGDKQWQGTLTTTLEFNSTAKAYLDALIGGTLTQRQIRLKATSGTSIVQIDFAGTLDNDIDMFGDRDGNMTVQLKWAGTNNVTLGNWLKASVTNSITTIA